MQGRVPAANPVGTVSNLRCGSRSVLSSYHPILGFWRRATTLGVLVRRFLGRKWWLDDRTAWVRALVELVEPGERGCGDDADRNALSIEDSKRSGVVGVELFSCVSSQQVRLDGGHISHDVSDR